jgi:hypothetical protein
MSVSGRAQTRQRMLRRAALVVGILVLLALVLLVTGHWVLGLVFGVVAAVAVVVFFQVRTVR